MSDHGSLFQAYPRPFPGLLIALGVALRDLFAAFCLKMLQLGYVWDTMSEKLDKPRN